MFRFEAKVRLHDTDAAGLLFFGNQFRIAHDAYEAFLESIGYPMSHVLSDAPILLPIVHAEADYQKSLRVGDKLTIEIRVEAVSTHSFELGFYLVDALGKTAGTARTVHVSVDKKTRQKTPLPEDLKKKLETFV